MEIIAEFFKTAWGWFCTHLSEALLVNAIVAFVFWVFGFLGRKIVVFFRGLIVRSRNKETKKGYRDSIISFDTVSPYYDSNLATMYLTPKRFVFEIPEEKRKELAAQKTQNGRQKFAIHEPAKLDGNNHMLCDFLSKYYAQEFPNVEAIEKFLNKTISDTADYFIDRLQKGKLAFNNRQIRIDRIEINRTDKEEGHGEEKQILDLALYETDYFTAQVMVHVYQHLCELDIKYRKKDANYESPFDHIDIIKLNTEMRPFMSSLGVGGYIIFDRGNTGHNLEYWTVKRSSNVRNGSNGSMDLRSYSFDETMDLKDRTEDIKDSNIFSAYVGADRAIQEELGLFNKRDERVRGNVGNFHLTGLVLIRTQVEENARFEMQLLGYTFVHFTDNFKYDDLVLKKKNAQDASYEAVEVYPCKLKEKLTGTVPGQYTHTPESVYYAEVLQNMEDMKYIRNAYLEEVGRL